MMNWRGRTEEGRLMRGNCSRETNSRRTRNSCRSRDSRRGRSEAVRKGVGAMIGRDSERLRRPASIQCGIGSASTRRSKQWRRGSRLWRKTSDSARSKVQEAGRESRRRAGGERGELCERRGDAGAVGRAIPRHWRVARWIGARRGLHNL